MKIITYAQSTGFVDVELVDEWDGHIANCEFDQAGFSPGMWQGDEDGYCYRVHHRTKDAPHDWHAIVEVCGFGYELVLVKGPADLLALQLALAPMVALNSTSAEAWQPQPSAGVDVGNGDISWVTAG